MPAWRVKGSRKKQCPFCSAKKMSDEYIDYKNSKFLRKFITETGKIVPSRITGLCNKHQHAMREAINFARSAVLLPYCDRH